MIKDIAEPINVLKTYTTKILQNLSKRHLVYSTKGSKGGFYLSKENRRVKPIEIRDAVDGEERLHTCLLSLKECNKNNPCSIHHLAYDERQIMMKNFSLIKFRRFVKTYR
ncbi:RrF2 family transcriptional regulator [Winogradskyella sp. UBA3174]|uniref:RrF2 family transcriptional regulator n=1 Tax=Winogradskyella sp. UBA3174 TaxID=1947785 RepID=UPI0025FB3292|nr:Rrf2 family transcriptional regulator [Winogradskyella sp. UBA3174]|tara:strand:- start:25158 stop:25487 length:330 start_codon:yes stop_codon:yes gene_type:complete